MTADIALRTFQDANDDQLETLARARIYMSDRAIVALEALRLSSEGQDEHYTSKIREVQGCLRRHTYAMQTILGALGYSGQAREEAQKVYAALIVGEWPTDVKVLLVTHMWQPIRNSNRAREIQKPSLPAFNADIDWDSDGDEDTHSEDCTRPKSGQAPPWSRQTENTNALGHKVSISTAAKDTHRNGSSVELPMFPTLYGTERHHSSEAAVPVTIRNPTQPLGGFEHVSDRWDRRCFAIDHTTWADEAKAGVFELFKKRYPQEETWKSKVSVIRGCFGRLAFALAKIETSYKKGREYEYVVGMHDAGVQYDALLQGNWDREVKDILKTRLWGPIMQINGALASGLPYLDAIRLVEQQSIEGGAGSYESARTASPQSSMATGRSTFDTGASISTASRNNPPAAASTFGSSLTFLRLSMEREPKGTTGRR